MNIEELRNYCISIKGSSESTPFVDDTILVFKVMGKMFAYIALEPKDRMFNVCLKCHPDKTIELREKYKGITETAFKSLLWNSVYLESDVPDKLIKELIGHSVDEVIKKLPKGKREEYTG
ncbi:MAG: MmcQ/YjbR family DNA-binding protein [Flavobacteriaceae bacterium]|jgi:predicted DNA-binding protein (MmcQ/YjbR family)|nr:MmcQ/YjbR family DNA-binding protein [Flavobacteriaceae bacterium]